MQLIDVKEVQAQIFQIIEQASQGEEVIITNDEQPLVKLSSAIGFKKQRQFGSVKGLIKMADDFDEPLEEFRGYM
jgi:antitoxin (DNA-binding transcriptional repressor) of toxin-antitoxin stability system